MEESDEMTAIDTEVEHDTSNESSSKDRALRLQQTFVRYRAIRTENRERALEALANYEEFNDVSPKDMVSLVTVETGIPREEVQQAYIATQSHRTESSDIR